MKKLRTAITAIFLLACTVAAAQGTLEELREQMRRDQQKLNETTALLGKNRDKQTLSEREFKIVQNSMDIRRDMIRNLDAEAALITAEITSNTRQVRTLDEQLTTLKEEYGQMVYSAWKNYKMNTAVAFLFASRDFNDATRRMSHMKRYNQMRETKGAEIDSLNYVLQYELDKLNLQKEELDRSKAQKSAELATLAKDEKQIAATIEQQKIEGKKLKTEAEKLQAKIKSGQKQIDKIIAEQAKAGKTGRTQAQIERDIVLSGKFEDNKGKLPWPAGGPATVTDHFGRHAVSSQKGITNDFKGINIAAPRGAQVKAVFEGEVTGVYNLDHFNNCVMVRSGSYIVLYANLARNSVKAGDKIAINQEIGRLFDTDDEDKHMLIFQIWKETTPVDPELWLRR